MQLFKKKGTKVGYNLIKVSQQKNQQFKVTIPKQIAKDMGLRKGDIIHFEMDKRVIPAFGSRDNTIEKFCIIKKTKDGG